MEKINPIAEELLELGSVLGNYPALTPYRPVTGFFDEFPGAMLAVVREQELPTSLSGLRAPFEPPSGYFEGLAGSIMDKVKKQEQQGIRADTGKDLSADEEIAGLSPLLSGLSRKMPYELPVDYFAELTHGMQHADDALSPLMTGLKAVNVFEVPADYFDTLPGVMLSKVRVPAARVVRGNFAGRIARYAAAAVIVGAMITGGFFLLNRNEGGQQIVSTKGLEEKAAQTSDEDILQYLENQPAPTFDGQTIISDKEIKDDAILDMLADVSDEELQQYVQYQSDTKQIFN